MSRQDGARFEDTLNLRRLTYEGSTRWRRAPVRIWPKRRIHRITLVLAGVVIGGAWIHNALSYHPSETVRDCYDAWITEARDIAKATGYSEDKMIEMSLFGDHRKRCDQLKAQDEDAWRTGRKQP